MVRSSEGTDQAIDSDDGSNSPVQCSICLELVKYDGGRSNVKLQCGHEFHLDCIGSAFNIKGIMQCPNCRNTEQGQWLYAIGSANSIPDLNMDAWTAENYPVFVVPYGFQICPYRGLMETEDPASITGHHYFEHHESFGPTSSPPGLAYITYFRPQPYAPLNPNSDQVDVPSFTPFDDSFRQNDTHSTSYPYPIPDMDYQPQVHLSPATPFPGTPGTHMIVARQQLPPLNLGFLDSELEGSTRPRYSENPYTLNQRPGIGSSIIPMVSPPQAHGDIHSSPPFNRHPQVMGLSWSLIPSSRRSSDPRGSSTMGFSRHPSDQRATGPYYPPHYAISGYDFNTTGHVVPSQFHAWGRDRIHRVPAAPHSDQWLRFV